MSGRLHLELTSASEIHLPARAPDIGLRRKASQPRARATVEALLEAGAYVLRQDGVGAFTTNRVAEKAGVNIASLYQYFPNKEALLFHIAQAAWKRQLGRLEPLLTEPGVGGAARLRRFIAEFFRIEADEADLRRALRAASVDLRTTPEFATLVGHGAELTRAFLAAEASRVSEAERPLVVDFMVSLITSFAERTTDLGTTSDVLERQAELLSDMLIERLGVGQGAIPRRIHLAPLEGLESA